MACLLLPWRNELTISHGAQLGRTDSALGGRLYQGGWRTNWVARKDWRSTPAKSLIFVWNELNRNAGLRLSADLPLRSMWRIFSPIELPRGRKVRAFAGLACRQCRGLSSWPFRVSAIRDCILLIEYDQVQRSLALRAGAPRAFRWSLWPACAIASLVGPAVPSGWRLACPQCQAPADLVVRHALRSCDPVRPTCGPR